SRTAGTRGGWRVGRFIGSRSRRARTDKSRHARGGGPFMKCLVTGAAGFIGAHLCERLLAAGHAVVGLDAFIPYYPRAVKEANLAAALAHRAFAFRELDLRRDPLDGLLDGAEAVFHLAAMPG